MWEISINEFSHNQFWVNYRGGYLHKDGTVRNSTLYNGKYTGFFDTKEDAVAALIKAMSKDIVCLSEEESFATLNAIYHLSGKNLDAVAHFISRQK